MPITPQPRNAAVKIQAQRERAQHLVALRESPSFPIFKEIVETKIRREVNKFIGTAVISQQELDYGRGFFNGLQTALDIIEKGEAQLEAAIRAAQTLEAADT